MAADLEYGSELTRPPRPPITEGLAELARPREPAAEAMWPAADAVSRLACARSLMSLFRRAELTPAVSRGSATEAAAAPLVLVAASRSAVVERPAVPAPPAPYKPAAAVLGAAVVEKGSLRISSTLFSTLVPPGCVARTELVRPT